jgi:hypothetical protein
MVRRGISYFILLLLILSGLFPDNGVLAQEATADQPVEVVNDTRREEIQRYFGYETLIFRYLSLPYDISMNTNQTGNFVDIGPLYILFLPLLFIMLLRSGKWLKYLAIFYLFFTWVISTSNGFLFSATRGRINPDIQSIDSYLNITSFTREPFTVLLAYLYKFSLWIYQPLGNLADSISGDADYVTYPIIFTAFVLSSIRLARRLRDTTVANRLFISFFWVYSFYWFAFSGGIIWYGYILLLSGLMLIAVLIKKMIDEKRAGADIIKRSFIAIGAAWALLAMVLRTSDLQPMIEERFFGKGIFNPVFYDYACGKMEGDEAIEIIYTNLTKALERINSQENSLVWRVGTSFSFFIERNNERIILDNQMGLFYQLRRRYPDNSQLVNVMKASNVQFLIVDLNTATIDNTPDKSLTAKYRELLYFVINNPRLKLLATDRIVGKKDQNGKSIYTYDIYGEQVEQFGRYAIYELN